MGTDTACHPSVAWLRLHQQTTLSVGAPAVQMTTVAWVRLVRRLDCDAVRASLQPFWQRLEFARWLALMLRLEEQMVQSVRTVKTGQLRGTACHGWCQPTAGMELCSTSERENEGQNEEYNTKRTWIQMTWKGQSDGVTG